MEGKNKIKENTEPVIDIPKKKFIRFIDNKGKALRVYELSVQTGPR